MDKDNKLQKILIYPQKSKAMNLAFDVTPAKYVTGLITEKGVCEASEKGLKGLFKWEKYYCDKKKYFIYYFCSSCIFFYFKI